MDINLAIMDFEGELEQIIGNSNLPVGVAYYIMQKYTENLYYRYVGYVNSHSPVYSEEIKENNENE